MKKKRSSTKRMVNRPARVLNPDQMTEDEADTLVSLQRLSEGNYEDFDDVARELGFTPQSPTSR